MAWGWQIEHAYLITGDSDLVPAINAAKDVGVVIILHYKEGARHDELLQAVDECFAMPSDFFDDCLL